MTSPIPAMRGAGEVAPLPRGRAPQSTSTHQLGVVPPPTPVRMKTASPARGTTIPPLARASTPPPIPGASEAKVTPPPFPAEANVTHSSPTLESPRITRPSLPPPRPSRPTLPAPRSTSSGMPVPNIAPRATLPPPIPAAAQAIDVEMKFEVTPTMPTPSTPADDLPPSTFAAPAVSPFAAEPQGFPIVKPAAPVVPAAPIVKSRGTGSAPIMRSPSVDLTSDVIRGDNWFDVSSKVEKLHEETWVGKYTEGHRKSFKDWARMLAVPAIVAASVGVAIGVYISYRGGNHAAAPKTSASALPVTHVHAPPPAKIVNLPVTGTAPDPNAESANAATASAGGDQPQPPTKQEDAAKQEAAAAQAAANPNDPAAEPTLTHDVPAAAAAAASDAPSVQEIKTSHGVVKLVDVRINSKPQGATVMLVDDGKTSFLGTTPLATSVDATKTYDVIFTLNGRPTQMAHLDPATSAKLEVKIPHGHAADAAEETPSAPMVNDTTLEVNETKAETPKKVARTEAPKAVKTETPKVAKAETPKPAKIETPKVEKAVAKTETPKAGKKSAKSDSFDEEAELRSLGLDPKKPAKKSEAKSEAGAEGTLMVSSKPPCEILIDGKATGLTTPQRSIPLNVGAHKITFVNASANIKKTVAVSIKSGQSTKLIQDLMAL